MIFSNKIKTSNEVCKFSITLEFIDDNSNNLAKDEETSFDLMVEATQRTQE